MFPHSWAEQNANRLPDIANPVRSSGLEKNTACPLSSVTSREIPASVAFPSMISTSCEGVIEISVFSSYAIKMKTLFPAGNASPSPITTL